MSNSARSALAVAAVLALGSLTACGGTPNTVTTATDAPAPATSSAAPAPAAKTSGAFGDTITFPSGVAVKVSVPTAVPADQYAFGAVEGKIVVFDIAVTNGGTEDINAGLMGSPKVTYGATGVGAQNANDIQAGIGASSFSTILPGETQTVKVGYGIPAAEYGDVRMEVMAPNFTDKPAIFKGAVQ